MHSQVEWLTQFNPYDGAAVSTSARSVTVPNGIGDGCPAHCPPDLRQGGDWYVGVQALDGTEAEFSLTTSVVEPPPKPWAHDCDPSAPECRAPLDFNALGSGARPRGGGGGGLVTASLLALGAGAAALLPVQLRGPWAGRAARHPRRHPPRPS